MDASSPEERPVDGRLRAALAKQLDDRRGLLEGGAVHVGWKLGVGDRERIGGEFAVGYLTSTTRLSSGGSYVARSHDADVRADAEIAVQFRRHVRSDADAGAIDAAIAYYAAALEIVELSPLPNEPFDVVASNVFHRAVAFGETRSDLPARVYGTLIVNGERRSTARAEADVAGRVRAAARILEATGERLTAGDWLITGSIVQVGVGPGDEIVADLGALGAVALTIASWRRDARAPER